MKTILDLVRSAARKANIIAAGEELEGSQGQDGLECLNYILDGWALQRLSRSSLAARVVTCRRP